MFNKTKAKWKRKINKLKNKVKMNLYKKHWANKVKVDPNLILFESMLGRNYSCNPKAIYEEMLYASKDGYLTISSYKNKEFQLQEQ